MPFQPALPGGPDAHDRVVDLVRHAVGQRTDRLHLLGLRELHLQLLMFRLRLISTSRSR